MKHLLTIEEQTPKTLSDLVNSAADFKLIRDSHDMPLEGQTWGMIFNKASTRTRLSFEVGVHELGGKVIFLSTNDLQLGRGEPIKDTARVMGRMLHGLIIRTFAQQDLIDFAEWGKIPVINALTDEEHPCQILADLLTIQEIHGSWEGKKIAFIGDGYSNMSISWMWAAKHLGFELVLASPKRYQPPASFLERLDAPNVRITDIPLEATSNADVINTDVWLSMGQEGQEEKEALFHGFQVNELLLKQANKDHIVLHCLPAYRGKEITEEVLEHHSESIFQQAENRLHAQKAVLAWLSI